MLIVNIMIAQSDLKFASIVNVKANHVTRLDPLTPKERSRRMASIRGKDSKIELVVRRLVYGMGYRYRLHDRKLPGTPDMVFKKRKKVIFVHSCFWHQHECENYSRPKTRKKFWDKKLESNRIRDQLNEEKLNDLNWKTLVIWECQLKDTNEVSNRIRKFLEN